jgi:hypothetical protein
MIRARNQLSRVMGKGFILVGLMVLWSGRLVAQGEYAPVVEADVISMKLNHYFGSDKKSLDSGFKWEFIKSEFVVRKDTGKIPADLWEKLLGASTSADEIRGRWKLDSKAGQLVLSDIRAGDQRGKKEVRLPIYRTAPTVIRVGDPQYVFAVGARPSRPLSSLIAGASSVQLAKVIKFEDVDERPADGNHYRRFTFEILQSSGTPRTTLEIPIAYGGLRPPGVPAPVLPSNLKFDSLQEGNKYWFLFGPDFDKTKYPYPVLGWWPADSAPREITDLVAQDALRDRPKIGE